MIQARLHQLEIGVQRQLAFDLESDDISSEYIFARSAQMLAETQHSG